jgi:hypothetical protein
MPFSEQAGPRKMIKKILIVSLMVIAADADFRFGGVSSQIGRPDLSTFFSQKRVTKKTKFSQINANLVSLFVI